MALAVLIPDPDAPPGAHQFLADIGSNEYYEYTIGSRGDDAGDGDERLETIAHRSGLERRGASRNPFQSAFPLAIPGDLFSRGARDVQLFSYRDRAGNGPAVSRVVRVVPGGGPGLYGREPGTGLVAGMSGMLGQPMFLPCRRVGFAFQESALSREMFLAELLEVAKAVTPGLLQVLPSLLGSGGAGGPAPGGAGGGAVGGSGTPGTSDAVARIAMAVLEALRQQGASAPVAPGVTPPVTRPATPAQGTQGTPVACGQSLRVPRGRARALALAREMGPRVSRAQDGGVISGPVLMALISAAGPLLSSILQPLAQQAPQLLNILVDRPAQFYETILRMNTDARLQTDRNQQNFITGLLAEADRLFLQRQLVDRLGAGAASPAAPAGTPVAPLAQGASVRRGSMIEAKPAAARPALALAFETGPRLEVNGKQKSVYVPAGGVTLTARLVPAGGPAPSTALARGIVEVRWTDIESARDVLVKEFRVSGVAVGAPLRLAFTPAEMAGVARHRDLHVRACLRWPRPAGGVGTARGDHAIYLTDGHVLRAVGAAIGEDFPLRDMTTYRAFWHKVWEGSIPPGSGASRWALDVVCRYYLRGSFDQASNGRIETRLRGPAPDRSDLTHRIEGKMRTGLEVSVDELAKIMPALGGGPSLGEEQLAALKSSELRAALDLEATTSLRVSGNARSTGVVWVYPEVRLRSVTLGRAATVGEDGLVAETQDETVGFPFPSAVRFVTLKST